MNIIEYRDAGEGLRVGKVVYQTRLTVFPHIQITGKQRSIRMNEIQGVRGCSQLSPGYYAALVSSEHCTRATCPGTKGERCHSVKRVLYSGNVHGHQG